MLISIAIASIWDGIALFYRDAGNWKTWQTYVVEGQITFEELEPHLESDSRFISVQKSSACYVAGERSIPSPARLLVLTRIGRHRNPLSEQAAPLSPAPLSFGRSLVHYPLKLRLFGLQSRHEQMHFKFAPFEQIGN